MSRKVRKLKPTRLNVRAKTKIVPRSGRVWPRLWHLDWLQHVERSPFYVQDGKGAALHARLYHGAVYGQGIGLHGNSYAIPTKDEKLRTLPLADIEGYASEFVRFAKTHPDLTFTLTPIGCGLAGYSPAQIAWMFDDAPPNVLLPAGLQ